MTTALFKERAEIDPFEVTDQCVRKPFKFLKGDAVVPIGPDFLLAAAKRTVSCAGRREFNVQGPDLV
jgi:hypothetical protein